MKIKSLIVGVLLTIITPLSANNIVSNLTGTLAVDNGSLNYNVPLNLPKGVGGVKPSTSLNYSSSGGNGYLGQGWSITGLSAISRCGSNKVDDGVIRGVKYDDNDNVCLDGQRLIDISGTKWHSGAEFRTKIDTYSKIVYDGTNFKVWTKSGEIKTYTQINRDWFIDTVKDRFGNTIDYDYYNDANEIYLTKIKYADNQIVFGYKGQARPFLWIQSR